MGGRSGMVAVLDLKRRRLAVGERRRIRRLRIDDRLRRFIVDRMTEQAGAPGKSGIPKKKEAEPLSCPDSRVPRDDALGSSVQPWKA